MRKLLILLSFVLSVGVASTCQAAESTAVKIIPETEEDPAFKNVMKALYYELNHFMTANGIASSDKRKAYAQFIAWLHIFKMIENAAVDEAWPAAVDAEMAGNGGGNDDAARDAVRTAKVAASAAVAWEIGLEVDNDVAWFAAERAADVWDDAVRRVAWNAAWNALRRGESAKEIGRAARLAAFTFFLEHFQNIFEGSYTAALTPHRESTVVFIQNGHQPIANPMISGEAYSQFCDTYFAHVSSEDRATLGLHVFASQLSLAQQFFALIAGRMDPHSSISHLSREIIFAFMHFVHALAVLPLVHHNNLQGGHCG